MHPTPRSVGLDQGGRPPHRLLSGGLNLRFGERMGVAPLLEPRWQGLGVLGVGEEGPLAPPTDS